MSTIYEALRKAEERRRLDEAPALIGDAAWATRRPTQAEASRGRWAFWLLPLIIAALAGGWWLGRGSDTAPVTPEATRTEAPATPAAANALAQDVAVPATAVAAPTTPTASPRQDDAPAPDTVASPAAPPSQLEIVPQSRPEPVAAEPFVPAPTVTAAPAPAASNAATTPQPAPNLPTPLPSAAVDDATQPALAAQAAPPPVALPAPLPSPAAIEPFPGPVAATAPIQAPSATTGTPLLYEMPLGTRQTLPPLKLSMHVYSPDPARRVVIIDGVRLLEGGTVSGELRVTQITADGVVLQLGDQQFLLPRGGR